jgi:hypothetical protein
MTDPAVMIAVSLNRPAAELPREPADGHGQAQDRRTEGSFCRAATERAFDVQRRPAFDHGLHEKGDEDDTPAHQDGKARHSRWRQAGGCVVDSSAGAIRMPMARATSSRATAAKIGTGPKAHLARGPCRHRTARIGDGEHAMIGVHERGRCARLHIRDPGIRHDVERARREPDQHHGEEKAIGPAVKARQQDRQQPARRRPPEATARPDAGRTPGRAIVSAQARR